MMVGHALFAFALVAALLDWRGWDRERALTAGVVAGVFAAVPDVDMVYALVGLLGADFSNALSVTGAFWSASTVVHRSLTHSLVVAVPAGVLAGLVVVRGRSRTAHTLVTAISAALVFAAMARNGILGAAVMGAFVLAVAFVAAQVRRRTTLTAGQTAALALVGFLTHPWGDLFTGEPPHLLYPLDTVLLTERVTLSADPTLHLLGAMGVELAVIWFAGLVFLRLADRTVRTQIDPRVGFGIAYSGAVLLIPAPTLDLSYPFVFTILAVGLVFAALRLRAIPFRRGRTPEPGTLLASLLTGTAAITVAWVAYGGAYLLI